MKNQGGFTLLEVVVSILLFAIGVLGMMGLQVLATRGASIGNNNTVANYLAQSLASQLEQLSMNDPALTYGNHGYKASNDACLSCINCTSPVDTTGQCTAGGNNVYSVSWVVAPIITMNSGTATNFKNIAVTVSWSGGSFTLTLPAGHY